LLTNACTLARALDTLFIKGTQCTFRYTNTNLTAYIGARAAGA